MEGNQVRQVRYKPYAVSFIIALILGIVLLGILGFGTANYKGDISEKEGIIEDLNYVRKHTSGRKLRKTYTYGDIRIDGVVHNILLAKSGRGGYKIGDRITVYGAKDGKYYITRTSAIVQDSLSIKVCGIAFIACLGTAAVSALGLLSVASIKHSEAKKQEGQGEY